MSEELLPIGSTFTIKWNGYNYGSLVDISIDRHNGEHDWELIVSAFPNDNSLSATNSYDWVVTAPTTDQTFFKVSDTLNPNDYYANFFPITIIKPFSASYQNYPLLPEDNSNWMSKFSPDYDCERRLYDHILTEAYNKNGLRMHFYVSTFDTSYDKIWGEDDNRRYLIKFPVMSYYTTTTESALLNMYGMQWTDIIKMFISKIHFEAATSKYYHSLYIPKVGDVLFSTYNNTYYEIIDVGEEEAPFLQKKHVWSFFVRTMVNKHESVDQPLSDDNIVEHLSSDDIFNNKPTVDTKSDKILFKPPISDPPIKDAMKDW